MPPLNEHLRRSLESRVESASRERRRHAALRRPGIQPDEESREISVEDICIGLLVARAASLPENPAVPALAIQVRTGTYRVASDDIAAGVIADLEREGVGPL